MSFLPTRFQWVGSAIIVCNQNIEHVYAAHVQMSAALSQATADTSSLHKHIIYYMTHIL